ncbi:MAG: sulfatase, partial [Deltaproteobacteria bacterium]|nr:sulfatase [Deltaproteobacteria bacterium]
MPRLATAAAAVLLLGACSHCGSQGSPRQTGERYDASPATRAQSEEPPGQDAATGEQQEADGEEASIDMLADPDRIEVGADPGSRYVDLSRPAGLWILRNRSALRGWQSESAGGLEGVALDGDGLTLRLSSDDGAGRCMKLLVGVSGATKVQVARRAGRAVSSSLEQGPHLIDGPCPLGGDSIQDFIVKATGDGAVLAGVWLVPESVAPATAPPTIEPCKNGAGIRIAPGTSARAAALAPPGSRIDVKATGPGAGVLDVSIITDAAEEPIGIALERVEGGAAGSRGVKSERAAAIEVLAFLPASAAGPACLERMAISTPPEEVKQTRPGTFDAVVLIVSDTMRGDLYPHAQSSVRVEMPNLQAFASRSTNYLQATAHSSYTKPSVGTILTGLYPDEHGGLARKAPVSEEATLVSEILEKAGVHTVAFLSNFFFNPSFGMRRGWSETHSIDPWNAALDDEVVIEEVQRWTQGGVPDGPLFVYIHLMAAHAPYTAPERIRKAFLQGAGLAARLSPRHTAQLIKDLTSGKEPRLTPREKNQLKSLYRADAAYHDEVMGRLLEALEESKLLDRALVIYTSDHGEEFYEHGRVGHGTGLWHEQVHVPLIVRTPGQDDGAITSRDVGHIDIVPTVLEAFGRPVPPTLHGRSLLALAGEPTTLYRPLLLQHWTGRWGIQLGPWKLQRRPADERLSWSFKSEETEMDTASVPVLHRLLRRHLAWSY